MLAITNSKSQIPNFEVWNLYYEMAPKAYSPPTISEWVSVAMTTDLESV
jgi:hypothetical protein